MKRTQGKICIIMAIMLFCIVVICGCTKQKNDSDGKLNIVVTAFPHYDFARQIGDGKVNVTMLLKPGTEMHSYDPTPSDMAKISSCDIFIYTGGESDNWAKNIIESAGNKNMAVISFTEICPPLAYAVDGEHHQESDGHHHQYDEHVWTSPKNAMLISDEILRTLCEKDSVNADYYTQNHACFTGELEELDTTLCEIMKNSVRKTVVVADRFPFLHLANQYGINYISAFPGCSSETEPSAVTIAQMSRLISKENLPCVFIIEFSNGKIAKTVTDGTDAQILTLHSCHNVSKSDFDAGITYIELMTTNAENLRKALY